MKLSSLYFNYIKNEGVIRLMFVAGCVCSLPLLTIPFIEDASMSTYEGFFGWLFCVLIAFYWPFVIAAPVKFIKDGFKKSKK